MHAALRNNAQVFFQAWTFLAIAVLLIVWPIPHTIAARNIAIYSGLAAALAWFSLARPKLSIVELWPALCLLAVPAWVLLHWFFISNLQELQWQELSSTWLRTVILVILGAISGLMVARNPRFILYIVLPIAVLPLTSLWLNLEKSVAYDIFILTVPLYGIYTAKFLEVYFVLLQVLIGFALTHLAVINAQAKHVVKLFLIGFFFIFTGATNFIYAQALNGILMIVAGSIVFSLVIIIHYFKKFIYIFRQKRQLIILFLITAITFCILFLLIVTLLNIDKDIAEKSANLRSDIALSVSQFEHNKAWASDGSGATYPLDEAGRRVNVSTYERVSWFLRGAQFIADNPLGNGISHLAFGYYMRADFPDSRALMTHSAWIDFTLGLGLPALVMMWLAIFGIVYRGCLGLKSLEMQDSAHDKSTQFPYARLIDLLSIWLTVGIFSFWTIGEVSERIFIENFFFLLAFFSMAIGKLVLSYR
jgi:hypothetical protein